MHERANTILQDSVRRGGVRGHGTHNDWNSRDSSSETFGERIVLESVCEVSSRVFQAYFVVYVKTGGMFLRITQNGEFVPALVALWCADKRLFARARWTRTVAFLQSCDGSQCCDLMALVKSSSALCRTRTRYMC